MVSTRFSTLSAARSSSIALARTARSSELSAIMNRLFSRSFNWIFPCQYPTRARICSFEP